MQTLWMKSLCWGRGAALLNGGGATSRTSAPSRSFSPSYLLPSEVCVHVCCIMLHQSFLEFQPHSQNAEMLYVGTVFIWQMFWCWWHQGWRQSLRLMSAHRRMTPWLPATNLRLTPSLAQPVGSTGLSLALVWPGNCGGVPAVDTSLRGLLCSQHLLRARLGPLTPWTRTAGTANCLRRRPQVQVSLMLL